MDKSVQINTTLAKLLKVQLDEPMSAVALQAHSLELTEGRLLLDFINDGESGVVVQLYMLGSSGFYLLNEKKNSLWRKRHLADLAKAFTADANAVSLSKAFLRARLIMALVGLELTAVSVNRLNLKSALSKLSRQEKILPMVLTAEDLNSATFKVSEFGQSVDIHMGDVDVGSYLPSGESSRSSFGKKLNDTRIVMNRTAIERDIGWPIPIDDPRIPRKLEEI